MAIENMTGEENDTVRTPIRQIAWPRAFRIGARVSWHQGGRVWE
jgi:hypothetical protein